MKVLIACFSQFAPTVSLDILLVVVAYFLQLQNTLTGLQKLKDKGPYSQLVKRDTPFSITPLGPQCGLVSIGYCGIYG